MNPYIEEKPEEILKELRATVQSFLYSNNDGYSVFDTMEEFCQKFDALDKQLSNGGLLPKVWYGSRVEYPKIPPPPYALDHPV